MIVLTDSGTASSGESSAWALKHPFGARIAGCPSRGTIEYGNVGFYLIPHTGTIVMLPTKHNNYGIDVEMCGFPVDIPLDVTMPDDALTAECQRIFANWL